MKRSTTGIALGLGGTLAATFAFAGLAAAAPGNGPGNGPAPWRSPAPSAAATPAVASHDLKTDLTYLREEERLAREIYQAASDKYDQALPFVNIVRAEQRHFDAVGMLLTRYGVDDPAADAKGGVYSDDKLQAEYDKLLAQVNESREAAYAAGVAIEKMDIADLDAAIARTEEPDAKRVFENLKRGSEHHLAAFETAAAGEDLGAREGKGPQNGRGGHAGRPGGGQGLGRGPGGQGMGERCEGTCDGSGPQDGSGRQARGAERRADEPGNGKGDGQGRMGQGPRDGSGQGRGMGRGQGQPQDCPNR